MNKLQLAALSLAAAFTLSACGIPEEEPATGQLHQELKDCLVATPSSLAFGQVAVGGTNPLRTRLTNQCPYQVSLIDRGCLNPEFESSLNPPIVLDPGMSTYYSVTYHPANTGADSSLCGVIYSQSPQVLTLGIPVSGTGI